MLKIRKIADLKKASDEDVRKAIGHAQVIPRIDSFLEDMNDEPHPKRLGVFSASDIGTTGGSSLCGNYVMGCGRIMYYRYIGEAPHEVIQPRLRRIFNTGTKVHEQLQGYLHKIAKAAGKSEVFVDEAHFNETNSKVAAKYELDSTTDGIWQIKIKGEIDIKFGVEIKSIKDELYKTLNGPKPETVVQSIIYMACLDLPLMTIVYYNKNDSCMVEYPIAFDSNIWDAVVAKINYVREHAVEEELPPREHGFHCNTCRYRHVCKPPKRTKQSVKFGRRAFNLRGAN